MAEMEDLDSINKKPGKTMEDFAAQKIQHMYRAKLREKEDAAGRSPRSRQKLKVAPITTYRLEHNAVQELRLLSRKPCSGPDARPIDEDQRLYDILSQLPAFAKVFRPLTHMARLSVVRALEPRQMQSRDLILRSTEDASEDAACVVLHGEAALYVFNAGDGRSAVQRLPAGSQITRAMVSKLRITAEHRDDNELQVSCKRSCEVLRLPMELLEEVASEDEELEYSLSSVREILRSQEPWCREKDDLFAVCDHLVENCASFIGIPEEDIAKVCQQASFCFVRSGEHLCRKGELPDGLRVLLTGSASVLQPGTSEQHDMVHSMSHGSADGNSKRQCSKSLYVDEAIGERELCLLRDDGYTADVVADCDCEVLFISRALYKTYMQTSRRQKVLRQAALASLMCASAATLAFEREHALDMNDSSPHDAEPHDHGEQVMVYAPTHVLPESVEAIDCMLRYSCDSSLALLSCFPQDLRRQLCKHAKLWRALRGEVIFREGESSKLLFIVIRGQVGRFQRCETTDARFLHQRQILKKQLQEQAGGASNRFAKRGTEMYHCSDMVSNLQRQDSQESQNDGSPRKLNLVTVMASVASSLYDVASRRWQKLRPPRVSVLPVVDAIRRFIRDGEAEKYLLGQEITSGQADHLNQEDFVESLDLGVCTDIVDAGQSLGISSPGMLDSGPPRSHTAVALSGTVDLLVIDHDAVTDVLARARDGIPAGNYASTILRSRQGNERTAQDLFVLDSMIKRHQAFKNLESRTRAEICRRMSYIVVPCGETVCWQGDASPGYFHILSGQASLHVRLEPNLRGALFPPEDDDLTDADDDGPAVLCLSEGSSFGEQELLGERETQPHTIRAVTDLELAWITFDDYNAVTQDWQGETSFRRRVLEVARRKVKKAPPQRRKTIVTSMEPFSEKDAQAMMHVMRNLPHIQHLDVATQLEIGRHANLLHVPVGEPVPLDGHLETYAICVVLAGCIGHYPVYMPEEPELDDVDDSLKFSAAKSRCGGSIKSAAGQRPTMGEGDETLKMWMQLQSLRALSDELHAVVGQTPLKASLQDRLKFHSVKKEIASLEAKLKEIAPQFSPLVVQSAGQTKTSPSKVSTCVATPVQANSVAATSIGEPMVSESHDQQAHNGDNGGVEGAWGSTNTDRDEAPATFDLTQPESDLDSLEDSELPPGTPNLLGCEIEYREGHSFGGWDGSFSSSDVELHAHADTELLVIGHSTYSYVLKLMKERLEESHAAFLRSHLPSKVANEFIEKIAPFFHQEVKPRGSVVVREGCHSNTIWLIMEGACRCKVFSNAPVHSGGATANAIPAGAAGSNSAPAHATEDHVAHAAHVTHTCHDAHRPPGAAPFESHGERNDRGGTSTPPPALRAQGVSSSIFAPNSRHSREEIVHMGRCKAHGAALIHMPATLGLLEKGKFIGLFSALLHEPEPNTIEVSSANVRLLGIPKHEFFPRVPGRVFELLKNLVRNQDDWHAHQSARIAALPGQVSERLKTVRCEVQQSNVPRIIDSPFLRRQGHQGLDMLDNICNRYGNLVHPESEWLFESRSRTFFQNVRLANLEDGHPEAVIYADAPEQDSSASTHFKRGPANWRFKRFNELSHTMKKESADNEYLAPPEFSSTASLSPQSVSQVGFSTTAGLSTYAQKRSADDHHDMQDMSADKKACGSQARGTGPASELCSETHVPLLVPSRMQRSTEYGDIRMKIKQAEATRPPPKPVRSPCRMVPGQVHTYKSKAMRDRQAAGHGKVDADIAVPIRRLTGTPPSPSPRVALNKDPMLPPILALASNHNGDFSDEFEESHSFMRRTINSATPYRETLRRGTENLQKAAAQLVANSADKSLGIALPGSTPQYDPRDQRMSLASQTWSGEARLVKKQGRLAPFFGSGES